MKLKNMGIYIFLSWLVVMACTTFSAKVITIISSVSIYIAYLLLKKIVKKIKS